MGYENLKGNLDGLQIFGEKKNTFLSVLVLGINNDQSLNLFVFRVVLRR